MKITVLPTGNAPDYYTFNGEVVTAHKDGQSESFDLSGIEKGDKFQGVECDTLDLNGAHVMREVYRDDAGELHLKVCQKVGPGHWEKGVKIDVTDYAPNKIHVLLNDSKPYSGMAWVITSEGEAWVQ